jgi:hypothetical protein
MSLDDFPRHAHQAELPAVDRPQSNVSTFDAADEIRLDRFARRKEGTSG